MQTIATFLAATALIAGVALANAQSTSPRGLDSRTPAAGARDAEQNRRAVDAERNPDRIIGDYKTPRNNVGGFTTGAGSTGSPSSADNPGLRRNPDGSFGGTPENPHPR
jgi:hypothetical protein